MRLQILFFMMILFVTNIFADVILKDLTGDGLEDRISILQKNNSQDNILTIESQNKNHNFHIILKKTIPKSELYHIMIDSANNLYKDKNEGISFTINYKKQNALILETSKDGYLSRYRFYFLFDKKSKTFLLDRIYYLSFNQSCDHSLNAIYLVNSKKFDNINLNNFQFQEIYNTLYETSVFSTHSQFNVLKIEPLEFNQIFEDIRKAYKTNNFNDEVSFLLSYTNDKCNPEDYIVEKYFYASSLEKTNDIANYLEQANYNDEAIFLLENIIEEFPSRTVAYLNLGDAYLKNGNNEKAIENYKIYINQMKEKNKEGKIPKRVLKIMDDSKTLDEIIGKKSILKKEEKTFFQNLLNGLAFQN